MLNYTLKIIDFNVFYILRRKGGKIWEWNDMKKLISKRTKQQCVQLFRQKYFDL